jgi:hypothetical protein
LAHASYVLARPRVGPPGQFHSLRQFAGILYGLILKSIVPKHIGELHVLFPSRNIVNKAFCEIRGVAKELNPILYIMLNEP